MSVETQMASWNLSNSLQGWLHFARAMTAVRETGENPDLDVL